MKTLFLLLLALAPLSALALSPRLADHPAVVVLAPTEKPPAEVQLKGVLEQQFSIGGETTGWVLRYGKDQRVQVELPRDAFNWIRSGATVVVTGHFSTRDYPERGSVTVFVVTSIMQVMA